MKRTPTTVEVTHDVDVTGPNNQKTSLKKGAKIKVGDDALIFESTGHVSVLMVPMKEQSVGLFSSPTEKRPKNQVKLTLKEDPRLNPDKLDAAAQCEKHESEKMNELLSQVEEVQELMATSNFKLALDKISQLQVRFPTVSYLGFLKASGLVLAGDHEQAKSVLQKAMRDFPNQKMASDLLLMLSKPGDQHRTPASEEAAEGQRK